MTARGGRVAVVGPSAAVAVPAGARVVDGRGRWLVPGPWDMHVHAFRDGFPDFVAPLMLAHGVAGVRDMGDDVDTAARWRRAAARACAPSTTRCG